MKAMKMQLVVTVEYRVPDEMRRAQAEAEAESVLRNMPRAAYQEGEMSGDTELTVETWSCNVVPLSWEDVP